MPPLCNITFVWTCINMPAIELINRLDYVWRCGVKACKAIVKTQVRDETTDISVSE